jgi:hypothetical protein
MMNNISQGYSLLADGELDAISRVIKGEMLFDEDEQQFYYTKGTNVFLPIDPNNPADITKIYNHEGIPQNYWGEIKLDTPTTNESSGDYDNL